MSKSIAHRIPGAGAMLLVALLSITLSMVACEDDAQSVRQANETAAASTATAETPTPSAEIHATELRNGDCINATLAKGISIDTVVIVPCAGDWQYRVLKSFQVADAEAYPGESFFVSPSFRELRLANRQPPVPVSPELGAGRPNDYVSSASAGGGDLCLARRFGSERGGSQRRRSVMLGGVGGRRQLARVSRHTRRPCCD